MAGIQSSDELVRQQNNYNEQQRILQAEWTARDQRAKQAKEEWRRQVEATKVQNRPILFTFPIKKFLEAIEMEKSHGTRRRNESCGVNSDSSQYQLHKKSAEALLAAWQTGESVELKDIMRRFLYRLLEMYGASENIKLVEGYSFECPWFALEVLSTANSGGYSKDRREKYTWKDGDRSWSDSVVENMLCTATIKFTPRKPVVEIENSN
jgi:hypothetical protein